MERRFALRKEEMLADCQVDPAVFSNMMPRLERFAVPFIERLVVVEQQQHAQEYMAGLISDIERKNAESMAYRNDEDRQGLQWFVGSSSWDYKPMQHELAHQVGEELGRADAVLVLDPSGFIKKGKDSVGVQRQWCGRLGKVENCQVGVFLGYVSREEHLLVDSRLYLPKAWASNKKRRRKAGVPEHVRFQTRQQLGLDMLQENGSLLPHAWVAADDEFGRVYTFRRDLNDLGEQYLLAVPSNTVVRDLEADPPVYSGRGPRPKQPFRQVRKWVQSVPKDCWTRIEVRDGEKGPLVVDILKRRVCARTNKRQVAPAEVLVITRTIDEEATVKHDYYLSNASPDTSLKEFARVTKAQHTIEECIKRSKSEAGLADYQVRKWDGWHHHITLSLIATWFLVLETRRGKKMDSSDHRAPSSGRLCPDTPSGSWLRHPCSDLPRTNSQIGAKRTRTLLPSQST